MSDYKGNSVEHWYAKAKSYGYICEKCWDELRDCGYGPDGKTGLDSRIREVLEKTYKSEAQLSKAEKVVEAAKEMAEWEDEDTGAYDNDDYGDFIVDMKRLVEALKDYI